MEIDITILAGVFYAVDKTAGHLALWPAIVQKSCKTCTLLQVKIFFLYFMGSWSCRNMYTRFLQNFCTILTGSHKIQENRTCLTWICKSCKIVSIGQPQLVLYFLNTQHYCLHLHAVYTSWGPMLRMMPYIIIMEEMWLHYAK